MSMGVTVTRSASVLKNNTDNFRVGYIYLIDECNIMYKLRRANEMTC